MPDVEQQKDYNLLDSGKEPPIVQPSSVVYERTVSTKKKLCALLGYFVCNVGLTVYNKAVLGKFDHPWLLTSIHTGSAFVGCRILLWLGHFHTTKLTAREKVTLMGFSLLFTINIAVSNVSLAMVSIPFHQVVRATIPLVTILIYSIVYNRTFSRSTYLSLLPVVLGVSVATYGDLTYTRAGFATTFLGVILAALKTIVTNRMLTGRLALSPLEILFRMSPLACIQSLVVAFLQGELGQQGNLFRQMSLAKSPSGSDINTPSEMPLSTLALILLGNGFLAFLLNVSSFNTNKLAGALTMAVCANIKQCLTIVLGIFLFGTAVSTTDLWGIVMTIVGGAVYSFVELRSK